MKASKREKLLLLGTGTMLLILSIFAVHNWSTIVYLFHEMVSGVAIVKETVLDLGLSGVLIISLIIIICFFFPVVSSIPVQLASAVSYGLPFAIVHVSLSVFVASQLAFLFTRCFRIFQTPKQRKKREEMEAKIQNSRRSIISFLFLAYLAPFVPFMLIHMVAANSGMKWWKYALVTLLGPLPDVIITLYLGAKITTTSSPATSVVILLLIIGCIALSMIYKEKIIDWVFLPKEESEESHGK